MSVANNFGKLQPLWDELATYDPLPACSCGFCLCDLGEQFQQKQDNDRLHEFLCGINKEKFDGLRSSLLSQDPSPILDRAYHAMLQEEQLQGSQASAISDVVLTMAVAPLPRGRGTGRGSAAGAGSVGRGRGGWSGSAPAPGRGCGLGPFARAAAAGADIGLNDKLTGKLFVSNLIIDSGASSHITGDLSILSDSIDISACRVGLPDGHLYSAVKRGNVYLSSHFVLRDVLYVPQFTCNLISVTQLTNSMNCVVKITKNVCIIQDPISRNLIGLGERRNGLYYFCSAPEAWLLHVNRKVSPDLWHRRLGHPSDRVVKALPFISSTCTLSNKACIVCHQTKHSRDSFVSSEHKATRCFELIHCHLWGPYNTMSSCSARYFITIVDDFSRAVWLFLFVDKNEVYKYFMQFCAMIDRQFQAKVQIVRSDNGTDFLCLREYFSCEGIIFQTSCVGTPQ
ncbi:hypothetical protein LIER_08181 [Lithospermum erythrorhizon]|uniref:Integrase catalytic domain-containing protein n=1 Tax=Lithospermum erythrorhizon TaxID=34254 RepID=A0AAV3PAX1_LITER